MPVTDRGDHLVAASSSAAGICDAGDPGAAVSPAAGGRGKCPPDGAAVRWSSGPAVDSAGRRQRWPHDLRDHGQGARLHGGLVRGGSGHDRLPLGILTGSPERSGQITCEPACAAVPHSLPGSRGARPGRATPAPSPRTLAADRRETARIAYLHQVCRSVPLIYPKCSPFLIVAGGGQLSPRGALEKPTRYAGIASYGLIFPRPRVWRP